jgi:hypothetical protein
MTLDELEEVYMNGFADDVTGDVDAPTDHVYRVDNCLVTTDSLGFHYVVWYATSMVAEAVFADIDSEYAEWVDGR